VLSPKIKKVEIKPTKWNNLIFYCVTSSEKLKKNPIKNGYIMESFSKQIWNYHYHFHLGFIRIVKKMSRKKTMLQFTLGLN
jgi:hypothetical protein